MVYKWTGFFPVHFAEEQIKKVDVGLPYFTIPLNNKMLTHI
jgi:hypothetical protein